MTVSIYTTVIQTTVHYENIYIYDRNANNYSL